MNYFAFPSRLNSGHVRCNITKQIFRTNGILLSDPEQDSVLSRYGNELGFCYTKFLDDVDPAEYAMPALVTKQQLVECPPFARDNLDPEDVSEEVIVRILTNAKRQAVVKSVAVIEFMKDYDRHREGEILESDFKRALDNSSVIIKEEEANILCNM